MTDRKRMLTIGFGVLGTLPIHVAFIATTVYYHLTALTIFWSVMFGAALTSAIGLIVRARRKEK